MCGPKFLVIVARDGDWRMRVETFPGKIAPHAFPEDIFRESFVSFVLPNDQSRLNKTFLALVFRTRESD